MLKKLIAFMFVSLLVVNINSMEENKRKGDFPEHQEVKRVDTSQEPKLKQEMQNILTKYAGLGNMEIVKLLLDLGANVNEKSNKGVGKFGEVYPLMASLAAENLEMANLLYEKGARIENMENELSWAAENGNLAMVKFLINKGTDVNGDREVTSPLSWAIINGHLDIVNFLINKGADVNIKSEDDGYTPLMEAVINGSIDIVRALIEAGAKINNQNNENKTALDFAKAEGNIEIYNYLLNHGAVSGIKETAPAA